MSLFTPLQKSVIEYIIAENENLEPPDNEITGYMRAFEGGFSREKQFTCFLPMVTKVQLYVAEERAGYGADRRTEFSKRCEQLKKPLVETARFIEKLETREYIRTLRKPAEPETLPKDYGEHWRRYENFYMNELEPIIFACTSLIIPRLKLYKYWENLCRGKKPSGSVWGLRAYP
jgi:hypothetical protein